MSRSVLVVGPSGTGGIAQFVDKQRDRFGTEFDVTVYDRYDPPGGDGLVPLWKGTAGSLDALARFPTLSRPDIVHLHTSIRFSFYRTACYAFYADRLWDARTILHIHGSSFDEFLSTDSRLVGRLQERVFSTVDDVIVLSEYWAETLAGYVDEEALHVVPNAVDPERYDPQYGADPVRFVYLSNLVPRKGVGELLASIERLDAVVDRPYRLDVAGTGPLADEVQAVAADHDDVHYHGYVSETRKRELLSHSSVFVLPTYAEGLPIALLEGMAGGTAVVATGVGAIPEVVGEDNGLLVEPGDVDGLVDALATLVRDPARVERMGRANRQLCERKYSWDRLTEQLAAIYGRAETVQRERPTVRRPRNPTPD
jgi:glycosyltransferase involved in cell wall biosynthesis